jgi:transcriptional regulator with XRE-family HTH domain
MTAVTAPSIPQWTLGDRLRKAREHAGMDQLELANRIGISRNTVSNYELGNGTRAPKVVVLRAWAHECGVPYEWVVDNFRPTVTVRSPFIGEWMSSTRPGHRLITPHQSIGRYRYKIAGNVATEVASTTRVP